MKTNVTDRPRLTVLTGGQQRRRDWVTPITWVVMIVVDLAFWIIVAALVISNV